MHFVEILLIISKINVNIFFCRVTPIWIPQSILKYDVQGSLPRSEFILKIYKHMSHTHTFVICSLFPRLCFKNDALPNCILPFLLLWRIYLSVIIETLRIKMAFIYNAYVVDCKKEQWEIVKHSMVLLVSVNAKKRKRC